MSSAAACSRIEGAELDRPPPAVRAEEPGRRLGELGPGRADDREPRLCVVGRDDVGDQVEQRRLGPVEVLEDQRRGLLCREQLQHATDPPVQLALRDLRGGVRAVRRRRAADQVRQCRRDRPQLVEVVGRKRLEEVVEPARDRRAVVALEDPGGRLDDVRHRPVRDPLAVGQASPPVDAPLLPCAPRELRQQAALADSRRADDRDEDGPVLGDRRVPHLRQRARLTLAADERDGVGRGHVRLLLHLDRLPDANRLRFALRGDRLGVAVVDRVPGRRRT